MAKILFYSDVHFKEFGSFQPFNQIQDNGLTGELNNTLEGIKFVCEQVESHRPDLLVNLGDWFQNTEQQPTRVMYASSLALDWLGDACRKHQCKHLAIPGNHDTFNEQFNITAMHALRSCFDEVLFEPTVWEGSGVRIGFLPATENVARVYYHLQEFEDNVDLICTHLDFSNCKYESGMKSTSSIKSDWKTDIISGDIHVPQRVGSVNYVGSLVQHRFFRLGLDQVGGVLLYDTDTRVVQRVANYRSRHYVKINDGEFGLDDGVMHPLPPHQCVLQVVSSRSREEVEADYSKYLHCYIRSIARRDNEVKVSYSQFSMDNPKSILRHHVKQERPDAVELFDEILQIKSGEGEEK